MVPVVSPMPALGESIAAVQLAQEPESKMTGKQKRMLAKAKASGGKREDAVADGLDAVAVSVQDSAGDVSTNSGLVVDAQELSVSVAERTLLEGAHLQLRRGHRYALLGINGCGKSTLVRLLAGGRIRTTCVTDVLAVSQELPGVDERSAFGELVRSDTTRGVLLAEEEALCEEMEVAETSDNWTTDDWSHKCARLKALGDELGAIHAHAATAMARRVLTGLGFSEEMQDAPLSTLSGGWRMRAALAQALFLRPGLLLLDEPTNHLDLPARLWLASYLTSAPMKDTCVLIVTHDVGFVADVATDLLHLDHFRCTLEPYKGTIWKWLAATRHRAQLQQVGYSEQQAALKALKAKGMAADKAHKKQVQEHGQLLPHFTYIYICIYIYIYMHIYTHTHTHTC